METFGSIIQIIGSFVTLVVLPVLLLNSKRKKAEAEADKEQAENITAYADEWKELYEKKEARVEALDAKVERLYVDIHNFREKIAELEAQKAELVLKNQALEFRKCNRHGCPDREPPSEY